MSINVTTYLVYKVVNHMCYCPRYISVSSRACPSLASSKVAPHLYQNWQAHSYPEKKMESIIFLLSIQGMFKTFVDTLAK